MDMDRGWSANRDLHVGEYVIPTLEFPDSLLALSATVVSNVSM